MFETVNHQFAGLHAAAEPSVQMLLPPAVYLVSTALSIRGTLAI